MKTVSLILVGFGNVGRAFARLIQRKAERLQTEFDLHLRIVAIATARHGMAVNPDGLDIDKALALVEARQPLQPLSTRPAFSSVFELIRSCPADVLLENTSINVENGQPAVDHLRCALEQGMHAITANKGPVVHAFRELSTLAAQKGRRFLFESTVMDGAPIFSLLRGSLPAVDVAGFHGILNSTTNLILGMMEKGQSFEQAVAYAQSIGIAETDPSEDVDGWDASVKVAALSTVLMGVPCKPQQVNRQGIRHITQAMVQQAQREGERWKLVCSARRDGAGVVTSVAPQRVSPHSPLYSIEGTSSYVQFELDVLPGLGIVESNPGPETTAYGLLADLINAQRESCPPVRGIL